MIAKRVKKVLPPLLGFCLTLAGLWWYVTMKVPQPIFIQMVTAAATIPAGMVIQAKDLRVIQVRAEDAPPGILPATAKITGQPAVFTILAGQPIFPADVGESKAQRFGLYPGEEGVTIKLANPNEVSGLAPGDWVKVYAFPANPPGTQPFVLRARLVALLASGGSMMGNGANDQVTDARIAVDSSKVAALLMADKAAGGGAFTVSPW